jgi:tRNA 2-thiouridine synthesizing protein E
MAIDVNGTSVETTENGYLVDINAWNEDVAKALAEEDGIELTEKHWDVVNYLRDAHVSKGEEPNERTIMKDMKAIWGKKPSSKEMFQLFPGAPSKQGRKFAGLPQSTRKGGY